MKVLLLSDHVDKKSGVGRVSHDIIKFSPAEVEWVQLGGAWNQPQGTDPEIIEVGDNKVKVYPAYDYGNKDYLREIISLENPDIILHFTDPRFWVWLYEMEFEIRKLMSIPIAYYSIWDNYPVPKFNKPFYNSCDLLIAINSIAHKAHAELAPDVMSSMIPHGVDTSVFYPLPYKEIKEVKDELLQVHNCDRILFWNNINMKRKNPLQLLEAFSEYYRKHDNRCCLVLHTNPIDEAGANLIAVKRHLYDDVNIIFSPEKISDEQLNLWYNISDGIISISSNEGFGLSIQEAAAANCRAIVLKTGGLNYQCNRYNSIGIDVEFKLLSGSQTVPYLYQDFASTSSIVKAMKTWKMFTKPNKNLHSKVYTAEKMSLNIVESLEKCVKQFDKNQNKFTYTVI